MTVSPGPRLQKQGASRKGGAKMWLEPTILLPPECGYHRSCFKFKRLLFQLMQHSGEVEEVFVEFDT